MNYRSMRFPSFILKEHRWQEITCSVFGHGWTRIGCMRSRTSWSKWAVITDTSKSIMHSEKHAYHIMHKANYLQNCREIAERNGVAFIEENHIKDEEESQTFDSRPPRASKNAMLQHFLGQEVEVDKPVFDASTAILMDFRVDQSQGMHFIYLLPYSCQHKPWSNPHSSQRQSQNENTI